MNTYPKVVKATRTVRSEVVGVPDLKEGESYTALKLENIKGKTYLVVPHKDSEILWPHDHFEDCNSIKLN